MIELIVFLGNPGGEYQQTRHNAGRLLGEALPFFKALDWQKKFQGRYASLDAANPASAPLPWVSGKRHFLMPETYMNCSGDSVYPAARFFKIPPERILVVHDELELPLGFLSIKFSGGLGGHKGLRSLKTRFGSADFWRLRIGIGRPDHDAIAGWVLSAFSPQERPRFDRVLEAAGGLLIQALAQGPESLLPEWQKKPAAPPEEPNGG